MGYIYLASPYSHSNSTVREARYIAARDATGWMLAHRLWVYSPIVHCHHIALVTGLPSDFVFWRDYNQTMIRHCEMLYVLQLEGWQESVGVAGEMEFARELRKPVIPLEFPFAKASLQ